jgi:hypothetical protein
LMSFSKLIVERLGELLTLDVFVEIDFSGS